MTVSIWTDGYDSIFAKSAEQARQWEVEHTSEDDASPLEEWGRIDPDTVLTIRFEDLEAWKATPVDERFEAGVSGEGTPWIKATAQAWVDVHMLTDGQLPAFHSTSEY